MSVTVRYVADPPQWKERGIGSAAWNTAYSLGDRLSISNSTYSSGATFECTTAGTSSGSTFNPTASPYAWGTSQWTLVTSDSWAKAATRMLLNAVNYVDCDSTYPDMVFAASTTSPVVFVEPTTMKPRNGRFVSGRETDRNRMTFFGYSFNSRFHSKRRFGDVISTPSNFFGPFIDFEGESANQSLTLSAGSRGGRVVRNAPGQSVTIYDGLSATRVDISAATGANIGFQHFGLHVEHSLGSDQLSGIGGQLTTRGDFLLTDPPNGYVSNNAYTSGFGILGSACSFGKNLQTYRDGAAGGLEEFSLAFGGHKNASYGAMWMSPFLYHYNTLTGSRTVTLHFITDSPHNKSLTDADIWLDCFYPSSNTTAQYSLSTTENANWGAPACSKSVLSLDTGETWTAPSIYYATKWKLSVTVSIQREGFLLLRLIVASKKISRNVTFVCPYIDVS